MLIRFLDKIDKRKLNEAVYFIITLSKKKQSRKSVISELTGVPNKKYAIDLMYKNNKDIGKDRIRYLLKKHYDSGKTAIFPMQEFEKYHSYYNIKYKIIFGSRRESEQFELDKSMIALYDIKGNTIEIDNE